MTRISYKRRRLPSAIIQHAVLAAESVVHEPFLMINADDFYGRDAFAKIAANLKRRKGCVQIPPRQ